MAYNIILFDHNLTCRVSIAFVSKASGQSCGKPNMFHQLLLERPAFRVTWSPLRFWGSLEQSFPQKMWWERTWWLRWSCEVNSVNAKLWDLLKQKISNFKILPLLAGFSSSRVQSGKRDLFQNLPQAFGGEILWVSFWSRRKVSFDSDSTLRRSKVRFQSPSAEVKLEDDLAKLVTEREKLMVMKRCSVLHEVNWYQ